MKKDPKPMPKELPLTDANGTVLDISGGVVECHDEGYHFAIEIRSPDPQYDGRRYVDGTHYESFDEAVAALRSHMAKAREKSIALGGHIMSDTSQAPATKPLGDNAYPYQSKEIH